jgi:hypothetical protein
MGNTVRFTTVSKNARAGLMVTWCDDATITLYTGNVPDFADDEITNQIKLAEFNLPSNPSGEAIDGVFSLALGTPPALVLTNGIPTFARLTDSGGTDRGDYDVGVIGSGTAVQLDNVNLIEGAMATLATFVQTEG